ncbi:MAG: VOC family protein [Acidimicrobiia bacterium]|nr:VOC family protein [Acidimicrobiia bacterium]
MFADRPLIPTLPAADIERAKAFYLDKLGLKPVEGEYDGGARFEVGGSWFLLYPSAFAGTNQATAAAWEVEDLEGTVTQLKSRGVQFQEFEMYDIKMENSILSDPDGRRAAWMVDSEGNIIGLTQSD